MKKHLSFILSVFLFFIVFSSFPACKKQQSPHSRYEITAEYMPKSNTLTGTVKVRFENPTDNALPFLKFQIHPNAYRENALYKPVSASTS